jgi:transcription-repair coupling factor (superfamily II helicase)
MAEQELPNFFAHKSRAGREQLKKDLVDYHLSGIEISSRPLSSGFISKTLGVALISENEIWGKQTGRRVRKKEKKENRILLET